MMNPILKYELRYWSKSPLTYFLITSMSFFALITMLGTGGYFDGPVENSSNVSFLNSPYYLVRNSFLFAKLLLFIVAIFFGFSTYRDYKQNIHHILYSYPLGKTQYLLGKYVSAGILVGISSIGVYISIYFGEILLGYSNPRITDFQSSAYLIASFLFLLYTLLIIGTFVFIVVTLTRNIYAGIITVVCFVLFQMVLQYTLFNCPDLLAILDPFGESAFNLTTQNWNHEIRNSTVMPIDQYVIINRLFWGVLAVGSFYFFSRIFDFHHDKAMDKNKRSNIIDNRSIQSNVTSDDYIVDYRFDFISKIKYSLQLALNDLRKIITSWLFILLSVFGIAAIFFLQLMVSTTGDFNLLPTTRLLIDAPLKIYSLIIVFSTFLFSGFVMDKARTNKMHLLVDVTPIKNWQLICSKVMAILMMQICQLVLFIIAGITIQMINGYHHLELGLYFISIFLLTLPALAVWNITSVFSHSLISNTFVSIFLLACLWFSSQFIEQLGIDTKLLSYNALPNLDYSDLNGYGSQLKGYFVIARYWIAVGILLILGVVLFWKRGAVYSFSDRFKLMRQRISPMLLLLIFAALIHLGFNATQLYKIEQKDVANSFGREKMKAALNEHKMKWQQYAAMEQPMISEIYLELDIFPKQRRFNASGEILLRNYSPDPIDTLFIRTGFDEKTDIDWNGKAHEILKDEVMKTHLYQLEERLYPGDSISFSFAIANINNTLFTKNSNVLRNGTFLKQDILPRIGYQFGADEDVVRKQGGHKHHFYHSDAHEVTLRTKISTSKDQVAIAPGELLSVELKQKRKYFEYITTTPQKLNFSFHSGDYHIIEDHFGDIVISIYCHKSHISNTARMIDGIKASLEYNSAWGNYPHKHIRIIEFPHTEESYAGTLIGNNIPTSELLFNINSNTTEGQFPFYVMAHELTHEWFGNQLKPAEAFGAKMLSESITEYITLCIYTNVLGVDMGNAFLKTQFERYRRGKLKERGKEPPLYQVEPHQDYLAYGKGTIALNQISKGIGKSKMNEVIGLFLKEYGNNQTRYPTSIDFIDLLKREVPTVHHNLINHWLTEVIDFNYEDISG